MRRCRIGLVLSGLLLTAPLSWANNSSFLPGDAFFHTELTEDVANALAKLENPRFAYSFPTRGGGYGCGTAGFDELEFVKMPKAFKANLKRTYEDLRKTIAKRVEISDETRTVERNGETMEVPTGKKVHRELNGFSLFFYNTSFDFNRHRLCLRYNEKWVEETAAFGHDPRLLRLDYFVDSAYAVADEWRDAAAVKPLSATCPKLPTLKLGEEHPKFDPIKVASGVKAIILVHGDFKSCYERSDGTYFLEVTETGVQRFEIVGGKWAVKR